MNAEELVESAERARQNQCCKKHLVCVCTAAACASAGAGDVKKALEETVKNRGLTDSVEVRSVGCMGLCAAGPLVTSAAPEPTRTDLGDHLYRDVKPVDAGAVIDSLTGSSLSHLEVDLKAPFFSRQHKIVLENCGRVDPERFDDYIAVDGYSALVRALTELTPAEVVAEVTGSGLRGRGGGGYPTGLKWGTVAKAQSSQKYVICNADEGDPGAFMDRSVLESDPHRVLEGMAIAGYAVGASKGYVYARAEYPLAIARLRTAIRHAIRNNMLGANICGTRFSFDIEVRLGAGAFVCGEETALMASIEGKRGQPRPRPPYPAQAGLFGQPTLINNVETFANVPPIVRNGGAWYAGIGTANSKGTKVFALAGRIVNTGLIEVPMGIPLRDIVFDIGGGIPDGRKFKALQTGGPSGGCIPEQFLDMAVDYDSLQKVGSIMGSGGMIVMDDTSSMVDVAKYFMEFCSSESCGKCVPCRVGTHTMHTLLTRIAQKEGTQEDLALLEHLCQVVRRTSLCGLGQTAPTPVLSTLRYFRHEYEQLVGNRTLIASEVDKPASEVAP